ncbi:tetratricopeptide repeat protein [Vibrio breoganii]
MMNRSFLTLVLMALLFGSNVNAQELSRSTANRVHQAYELQNQGDDAKAIEVLESVDSSRAFDTSYVQRMLGILYWQEEQSENAEKALSHSVELKGLPAEQHIETQRMLADIQLSNGKMSQALDNYHQVIAQNKTQNSLGPETIQQILLRVGQANYQMENWPSVLTASKSYYSAGGKTTTSVLNLRLGAELSLKQWNNALKTTLALRGLEPEAERWWTQTLNLYLRVGNHQQALSTLKQYERAGFELTKDQYRMMAQLYSKQGVPEKSAQILHDLNKGNETKAKDLAIEAQYWQQAREWEESLNAWARASSKDSDYRWSYIQLLMQNKQYKTAISQLNKVEESSRRELTNVEAYYRLGDREQALKHAQKANQIKSDRVALNWIRYLNQPQ